MDKKISENQLIRLLDKGCTTNLKGFKQENKKVEGLVCFDNHFNLKFEPKKTSSNTISNDSEKRKFNEAKSQPDTLACPKCNKGIVLKGKSAYGCSNYKNGCDFVFTFENIKKMANGQPLTKELVSKILTSK